MIPDFPCLFFWQCGLDSASLDTNADKDTNRGGSTAEGAMQTRTAWDLRQAFAHIPKG